MHFILKNIYNLIYKSSSFKFFFPIFGSGPILRPVARSVTFTKYLLKLLAHPNQFPNTCLCLHHQTCQKTHQSHIYRTCK